MTLLSFQPPPTISNYSKFMAVYEMPAFSKPFGFTLTLVTH